MNDTEPIEFFYDDGLLTQIRFNLSDKDSCIKNKKLILSTRHFKEFATSFHERHFDKEGLRIVEYYENNELTSYTEFEKNESNQTWEVRNYCAKGILFAYTKVIRDPTKNLFCLEELVYNADGTVSKSERTSIEPIERPW